MPGFPTKGNTVHASGARSECAIYMKVGTATSIRSGVFVIPDTVAGEFKVAGAGAANVIGVVTTRNLTNPAWDHTTAPAAGDEMEIIPIGMGQMVWVRNGANLAANVMFSTSATGRAAAAVVAAAGDNTKCIGRVLQASDGSGTETDALAVI